MSDQINWNVELRKIVREYDGLPAERSRTQIRLQKIQEIVARDRFNERLAVFGFWFRFALVAVLTLSLFWWPYGHQCGFPLVAFLLAHATVIAASLTLAVQMWRDRTAWAFVVSTLCAATAWTVIATHTLPRLGYAPLGETTATWTCIATR